jgi:hypothetical protein
MDKFKNNLRKAKERAARFTANKRSKVAALPKIPRVILDSNYVNPITLEFPKNMVVYELKNRVTGRTNYYDKVTFRKLITAFKNNYGLLMMNPKAPIQGARNPMTRNPIYPRNIRRVTVAAKKKTPSPTTAAKKIQSVVRKHLSKKRKTPSTSKSNSKSRSK